MELGTHSKTCWVSATEVDNFRGYQLPKAIGKGVFTTLVAFGQPIWIDKMPACTEFISSCLNYAHANTLTAGTVMKSSYLMQHSPFDNAMASNALRCTNSLTLTPATKQRREMHWQNRNALKPNGNALRLDCTARRRRGGRDISQRQT